MTTYTVIVQLYRNTETIGNSREWPMTASSHTDAARKALVQAQRFRLFEYATGVEITTCSARGGTTTTLHGLLRPAAPMPPKVFV